MNSSHSILPLDDDDRDFSHRLGTIQGCIYIPIFCAGLANNLLTILIILLNREMHTVTNCYLLNLAISDSLPLIVSLPFEITFLPIQLPWGELGCKFRSLLAETSTNASILTISAFTIERYLAVCHPLQSSFFSTTRRANKIQILIWFIAILSSTPYFVLIQKTANHCAFNAHLQFLMKICFYISASIFFVLPALILCFLYALMAQRLYSVGLLPEIRSSKSSATEFTSSPPCLQRIEQEQTGAEQTPHRHSSTTSVALRCSSILRSSKASSSVLSSHMQSMKKSAFKMLFAVVIAFIICYAPFHAQRLITSSFNAVHLSLSQQRAITIFYFISGILYYLGSTINPIFYHLFSRKYRQACRRTMKRIISCQRHAPHQQYYFPRITKIPPAARLPLYGGTPRSPPNDTTKRNRATETIYRSPYIYKTSMDLTKNRQHPLRPSLPRFSVERVRL